MSILKLSRIQTLLFHPDTPTGVGAIEDKALDKESVIELLGDDEQEQETLELEETAKKSSKDKAEKPEGEKKAASPDEESDEEEDKEKELTLEDELEEELQEPIDDEDLEVIEVPRRKEILNAFPELFKKFPAIEKAIYREQAYAKLLPTIEDAKAAAGKAELLDKYEKEIYGGSTESLLSTVKDNDREAFHKVVDNYLPNLFKVDEGAYYHTIGNVIKHTIVSMVRDSKAQDDEELGSAASILNKYIFGTTQFTPPQGLSKETPQNEDAKKKEDEISAKEKALVERQYTSARDSLGSKVDSILKTTIDKNIDPNEVMTEYVRGKATKDVLEGLEQAISSDARFKGIYDKLWERAFDSDFNKESMDRIKLAYLSKAKTLLPLLIRKARTEALKGIRRTDNKDRDKKGPLPVGKSRTSTSLASGKSSSNNSGNKQQVPRGMSTLDYLNSEE